ncbi:MAG: helix-turn-helix transcriptional regulator [Ruminococcaceae bacterium]|nr:helix-turn-helix transcriptional regulator [Oscillospiraceae bacterium]
MNLEDFGKRIKAARKRKGLTQEALAEKIDIAPTYISDIERGIKAPSLNTLVDLIKELEISADYVLQGSVDSGKEHIYNEITQKLDGLAPKQRQFISDFIDRYIKSLD